MYCVVPLKALNLFPYKILMFLWYTERNIHNLNTQKRRKITDKCYFRSCQSRQNLTTQLYPDLSTTKEERSLFMLLQKLPISPVNCHIGEWKLSDYNTDCIVSCFIFFYIFLNYFAFFFFYRLSYDMNRLTYME